MLLWDEVNTDRFVLPVIGYLYLEAFDGAKVNAKIVREHREKYARNYISFFFAAFYCLFYCDVLFHFFRLLKCFYVSYLLNTPFGY